jgi:hypothetical protein
VPLDRNARRIKDVALDVSHQQRAMDPERVLASY